jgi:hypothetical protein
LLTVHFATMPYNSKRERSAYTPPLNTTDKRFTSRKRHRDRTESPRGSTKVRRRHTRTFRSRTKTRSLSRRRDRETRREVTRSLTRSETNSSRSRSRSRSNRRGMHAERKERRSRHKSRRSTDDQHSSRRYVQSPAFRDDRTTMQKLIDALNGRGSESYSNTQNVIPVFDPSTKTQTTKSWLKKVNETAKIYKWTESQTIYHAIPKLSGVAKQWYEGLSTSNLTWDKWQKKLLQCFPDDRNYADRLIEMIDRRSKRDETLEQYFFDKVKLVAHCNIKGKDAVDCIIQGIYDHNIRLNAQGCNFKHTDKLLRYLRNVSAKNVRDAKKPVIPAKIPDVRATGGPKFMRPPNNQKNPIKCFNCSEFGHVVPKCPKPLQRCSKCSRMGHLAENCRREISNTERNGNTTKTDTTKVQRILSKDGSHDVYTKSVKMCGKDKLAYVDFGSKCSLIREATVVDLELPISNDNLPTIKGFAFGSTKPLGRVRFSIRVDFVKAIIDAFVVDDIFLNTDILIGQNLTELPEVIVNKSNSSLILYSIKLDMNKTEIYVKANVSLSGARTVEVYCNLDYTGYLYIPGNTSFKTGKEVIVMQGVYYFDKGFGRIMVINFSNCDVVLEQAKLLARSRLLPLTKDEESQQRNHELKVNMVEISKGDSSTNIDIPLDNSKSDITLDMLNVGTSVTEPQKQRLLNLLREYRDCFALNLSELGTTPISEMHIKLSDESPVSYKPYRLAHSERLVVRDLVNELLEHDIVTESDSCYASPVVLIKKKDKEYRLCVDYRALNKKTVKDSFPMSVIDDQLERLNGKKYFTSLDLKSGYYQIPVAKESRHLTAFVTPDGHYEYTRMPFGLVNAPAVFQHMINKALGKDRYDLAMPYMDDILSPATTVDEGLEKLRKILGSLRAAKLTLNLKKCFFFQTSLNYLGYEVSNEGLRPGQKKIEAVASFPTPTNVHQVRQFVGLASFFRRFISNFAAEAKPLTTLTKANTPWVWGSDQENAFQSLKTKLIERPLLALYDPTYITEVHCDASKLGVAGILFQKPDERSPLRPVAYFSKQTTKDEEFLHSYELETLAVVLSLKKFRTFLIGILFKVFTDCNALRTTLTKRDLIPRIARWWLLLQEYTFVIEYRPGTSMQHVDALSRNPIVNTDDEAFIDTQEFEILNITTSDWLLTVQMTDPKVKLIKTVLESNAKEIKDITNNYVLRDGKVYRRVGAQIKWVVPSGARWRICQLCHDEAGHFSIEKTIEKMKHDYWFPKLNRFVKKYVSSCMNCAYNKGTTAKPTGYLHPIPKGDQPFHTMHMDHLGPFVRSKQGNTYILAIIDGFSKFIYIKAVKNLKTKTTVRILQEIFDTIGAPKVIISDRGTSFTSSSFKKYVKTIGSKHILNAVATPRANGQIERYNRTILNSLSAMNHGQDERDWDIRLGRLQWSLNNTQNKTTGKTPSEIVFGQRSVNTTEGAILNSLAEVSKDTLPTLTEIRQSAKHNIEKSQSYMKKTFDQKRAPTVFFNEGDLVMIPNNHNPANGKSKKLCPKFRGPFKITAVLNNDRYEISSIDGHSKRKYKSVYPADHLKKWITFQDGKETDTQEILSDSSTTDDDK